MFYNMVLDCDLEVEVNGEEIFLVDKKILSSFSSRFRKLFSKSTATTTKLKVLFHDFPGGAEAFELMARFCYNSCSVPIIPSNVCLLHSVAHFMEMTEAVSHSPNLFEQTEKILEGLPYWTWPEILVILKQCQDPFPATHLSGILKKCLDSLAARIALFSTDTSPSTSSPDIGGFRFSCDTRSSESTKNSYHRNWWFDDLVGLSTHIIEEMTKTMISRKLDQVIIRRFLFYYSKSQLAVATMKEKCKILETVVNLLFSLDRSSVSCKGLFGVLRVASDVNVSKFCRSKLESMIGSHLDQATLDYLLVPSPSGVDILYDVDLVLRLLKSFHSSSEPISLIGLGKVGRMMDMYITEVAPDSSLQPAKFLELLMALPDSSRDTTDDIYQAVDIYLEVHNGLSEEEQMKICCAFNYDKLSSEACKHLAQNPKFPSRTAIQALLTQQSKLKCLLQDTDCLKSPNTSPCTNIDKSNAKRDNEQEAQNDTIKTHVQGMQCRVMELEKVCMKLQSQMSKIMKTRSPKGLPKPCS